MGAIGFPVPEAVLRDLSRTPTTPLERWAQRAASKPVGSRNWLPLVLDDYARRSRLDRSLTFTGYAHEFVGTSSRRELAARVTRKAASATAGQLALRLAPGRVPRCVGCGSVVVTLRPRARLRALRRGRNRVIAA